MRTKDPDWLNLWRYDLSGYSRAELLLLETDLLASDVAKKEEVHEILTAEILTRPLV